MGTSICKHVTLGKCYQAADGKKCSFKHPADDIIATIQCKVGRSAANSNVCKNGDKCKCNHTDNLRVPKNLFGGGSSSTPMTDEPFDLT